MRRILMLVVLSLCAAGLCGQSSPPAHHGDHSPQRAIPTSERTDLNHASIDELLKVPGMTRTWADRIVRFRPYRTRLDLLQEGVLPPDVYNRIKDAVVVHREKDK